MSSAPSSAPPPADQSLRRRRRPLTVVLLLLGVFLGGVLVLGGVLIWKQPRSPSPTEEVALPSDPPLPPLSSPFQNTQPGVRYLGDAACKGCHRSLADAYHQHPMGRSIMPATPGDGQEPIPATWQTAGLRLTVERRDGRLFHRTEYLTSAGQPVPGIPPLEEEITWTLGSGAQGRSYLIDKDGFLFQSPISWYRHTHSWDLSPGYQHLRVSLFSRPIPFRCLFCHADGAELVPGTLNHYVEPRRRLRPIGCERCHGPGELHVAARKSGAPLGPVDYTIVNPRHLEPELREAVCQQCHLQGEEAVVRRGRSLSDFRPGLPLAAFLSVFVRPAEQADFYRAVSHAEQMQVSRCFQGSKGKLGCVSCHDPHQEPAPGERDQVYRQACLRCHGVGDCSASAAVRQQAGDRCVACHMPRAASSNIAHAAITDHRIFRRPGEKPVELSSREKEYLLYFFKPRTHLQDPELERDYGLALVNHLLTTEIEKLPYRQLAQQAADLLDRAVQRAPGDWTAWGGRVLALWMLDRRQSAWAAVQQAVRPGSAPEPLLAAAVRVTEKLELAQPMEEYARQLHQLSPWNADYLAFLARAYYLQERWEEALTVAAQALERNPAQVDAQVVRLGCLIKQGRLAEADSAFQRLAALAPPNLAELRRWYYRLRP
jgi:predicted CXXCH cytochrome family protein